MKFRTGFVTNSSSNSFIITNVSRDTKTLLDVMRECSKGDHWYLCDWPFDESDLDYTDFPTGNEYVDGVTWDGKKIPEEERKRYLEIVASLQEFPPGSDVPYTFSTSHSDYGPVYHIGTLVKSKSFKIIDIPRGSTIPAKYYKQS